MEVIVTHLNADFDCLGSMVAARRLYPEALLVFPGSQERTVREFLHTAAGASIPITRLKDVDLAKIRRLVLVDCQHSSRIGVFAGLALGGKIPVDIYDHHSGGDIPSAGGVVRDCGSTSAILTRILMERGVEVTPAEATAIMLGVHEDTGSLTFPTTTPDDYAAAAWLLERGASLNAVCDFVSGDLTAEQVSLMNDLLKSLKTLDINGIAISVAHAFSDYYIGDAASVAHMIRDMENLDALFLVVDMGKRVYIVGRSRLPEVDAGTILREFGGGGHATAASATVKDMTLIEALRRLEEVLRERVNPPRAARDLMSSPVKTLSPGTTISDAGEFLTRYNINAAPVTKGADILGIITRRTVEKAIYHGLGGVAVTEYMNTDFMRASPDTPIHEIQDYIVGRNRRFVPVCDKGELVGAITRTDLLRYMYGGLRNREERAYDLASHESRVRRRDMAQVMAQVLPSRVLRALHDLGNVGRELDLPVYVVGGSVRDLLLGSENTDIDVTVEGDGILFAETFAGRFGCRVKSHRKFDTAVIVFPDGFKIDVASTRLEYYETPGALPTVERSSLKMDLYRRDFTINTLAIRIDGGHFGLLIDYFGGRRDLRDRVIRVLHNLSFVEDPTRVFRAIRFELRLGFHLSAHTENLITNAVRMNFLETLGGKRLLTELIHIFRVNDPVDAVQRMHDLGLLRFIHPAIAWNRETRAVMDEARRVVDWFQLLFLESRCEVWGVYLLALTSGLDADSFDSACTRLALVEHFGGRISASRRKGLSVLRMLEEGDRLGGISDSRVYFTLRDMPEEMLLYMMCLTGREGVKRMISRFFTHLQEVKLLIGGDDLREMGLLPGPAYREILDHILTARLDGLPSSREEELRLAQDLVRPVLQTQHSQVRKQGT